MRKVTVSIPEVHFSYITLEVDDDDNDQAMKEKANLLLEAGDYKDALEYSHTMDMEMWDITEEVICTSTDPTNHQGDTCPIHEESRK